MSPGPVFSHWLPLYNIAQELIARGHSVKWLKAIDAEHERTAKKLGVPESDCIAFPVTMEAEVLRKAILDLRQAGREKDMFTVLPLHQKVCDGAIKDNATVAAVQAYEPDLLVYDAPFPYGLPVANKLKIPAVSMWVIGPLGDFLTYLVGSPSGVSTMPQFNMWYPQPMSFWSRLQNTKAWAIGLLMMKAWDDAYSPIWRENGMPDGSYAKSQRRSVASIFQGDFAYLPALPMSPHCHVVGSLTARPPQALPDKLQSFLDGALDTGVIYISSGTSAVPDAAQLRGISKAVENIRIPVLWKLTATDKNTMKTNSIPIPKNVKSMDFLPQNDLLPHPAVKVFVTQGGTNSLYETIYHGTPAIIIPLIVEQTYNANQAEMLGFGLAIDLPAPLDLKILEQHLTRAFKKILASDSYSHKAKELSHLMRAKRWTPVEKAASVIEESAWSNGSLHNHVWEHRQPWIPSADVPGESWKTLGFQKKGNFL
ncbi:hypothetical protein WJX73_009149 [Symbiochloris irregularis]|uniref:Glycosyltransferase n=1 Tax=Symbiochloris irregularis TaxID=706552 RepID=A0AAW1NP20_9CHLO